MAMFRSQLMKIIVKDGLEKYVCSLIPSDEPIDHTKISRFYAVW